MRIHDDEPDTSEPVVRSLLHDVDAQWADRPLEYLATSGTDNAMWRVRLDREPDVVVRLPRRPGAAAGLLGEVDVLRRLEHTELAACVSTPRLRHVGRPHDDFPFDWSVIEWIDGADAWASRHSLTADHEVRLAEDLATAVRCIGRIGEIDGRPRRPGDRGGPIRPLVERLRNWLDDPQWGATDRLDVPSVRRLADEALEVADEHVSERFTHGDLIPGNLLLRHRRLAAVIDWGGAGRGDPAHDLAPAWAVLDAPARALFRTALDVDDATWIRGRTFELEHAVGGVLYYEPKQHPLGDVMRRTLDRILAA